MVEVKIFSDFGAFEKKIVFSFIEGRDRFLINPISGERHKLDTGNAVPDDFAIKLDSECIRALTEELSQLGIKTDSDAKLEGTLEATKYHLEDMRKMLFKDENNGTT